MTRIYKSKYLSIVWWQYKELKSTYIYSYRLFPGLIIHIAFAYRGFFQVMIHWGY